MGKALYRAYRARNFDDVIGQEHITKTLVNSLKNDRQSHAYLLTGPRGVGKTSVARILAHAVNDLPYDSEQLPIDIIEIDAASNRRIDEIRDIKEKAFVAPVQARYKVYIVDEVHMLTKESFNALLKTLEEPPSHVIFILATTEFHKLPETIVSRCIHFPFKPIGNQHLIGQLRNIADSEKIKIEDSALELIASHGNGSFRDSISLLDQIRSFGDNVTVENVRQALGLAPQELIENIMQGLENTNVSELMDSIEKLHEFGADTAMVAKQLLEHVRNQFIEGSSPLTPDASVSLMKKLLAISASSHPKRELELALIGQVVESGGRPAEKPGDKKPQSAETEAPTAKEKPKPKQPDTKKSETEKATSNSADIWSQTLEKLKTTNSTLYSIARMANHQVDAGSIVLRFKFSFHQKQMSSEKNLSTIKKILSEFSDKPYKLTIEKLEGSANDKPSKKFTKPTPDEHKSISNIFGATEVLES
jgi:DNA polymerase-3 subunit gamma/tau